jgi:hypothetical protein
VPYNTPGDFPNILSATGRRILETAPQYVGTTFQDWAYRRQSLPDFKPATLVRTGEFGEFPLHPDGHDFEQSTFAEGTAWIAVDEYGDEFGLTPRMIVDDDLGAFYDALTDKVAAHDHTLNGLCVNLLTGNPTLSDGYALFGTDHANLVSLGAAPNDTELAAMRLLLRRQKGISAKRKLNQTVNMLLIPEDIETTTEKFLSPNVRVVPITDATADIWRGRVRFLVEPRLADVSTTAFYGFADPRQSRSIVYCYQTGFERMNSKNYYNPKNNCRIWQFSGRFAAAVSNYRGVVKNNGTGRT